MFIPLLYEHQMFVINNNRERVAELCSETRVHQRWPASRLTARPNTFNNSTAYEVIFSSSWLQMVTDFLIFQLRDIRKNYRVKTMRSRFFLCTPWKLLCGTFQWKYYHVLATFSTPPSPTVYLSFIYTYRRIVWQRWNVECLVM